MWYYTWILWETQQNLKTNNTTSLHKSESISTIKIGRIGLKNQESIFCSMLWTWGSHWVIYSRWAPDPVISWIKSPLSNPIIFHGGKYMDHWDFSPIKKWSYLGPYLLTGGGRTCHRVFHVHQPELSKSPLESIRSQDSNRLSMVPRNLQQDPLNGPLNLSI